MIQLTPHVPIFIFHQAPDFRCGIDKLAAICENITGQDPKTGTVFVFRNRALTAAKILMFDGTGFWLCHKRLSSGRFKWWPGEQDERPDHHGLLLLLMGGDPRPVTVTPWRKIRTLQDEQEDKITRSTPDKGRA